jgi:hypothetical protein
MFDSNRDGLGSDRGNHGLGGSGRKAMSVSELIAFQPQFPRRT